LIKPTEIQGSQYLATKKGKHPGTCVTGTDYRVSASVKNTACNVLPTEKLEFLYQADLE